MSRILGYRPRGSSFGGTPTVQFRGQGAPPPPVNTGDVPDAEDPNSPGGRGNTVLPPPVALPAPRPAGGGGGGGGGGSSKHQYVFVPDAPVGVDVATGAQTMFHVSTAADEPLVRILVFAATAHSTNTFTITLEQYQNAGAGVEDITATGTWTTIKAITTTANVKFKSDTAPAATIKARGALRINITGTPTGWNGITVVYEVTRTTV